MDDLEKKQVHERAALVGLNSPILGEDDSDWDTLDELEELVETAGGECIAKVLQKRDKPDPGSFIGEGKAEEVKQLCTDNGADIVIFDNELSPSQIRNLEKILELPVIDRNALILDIFANRAQTSEGRLQVELAQYRYVLSKLSGMGKSMSRLGGGIGTRGPGESKLETDRRHIRRRIERLTEEFEKIRKVRGVQRERRIKSEIPTAAIVGYTNAGKSTLLNTLTGAGIHAADRLFDTLDPTVRKLDIENDISVLFSDTVGFIRKLPHKLVEAFKATLEEVKYADVIIHVIDASNPEWHKHISVVESIIDELEAGGTPRIRAYNKSDLIDDLPFLRSGDVLISAKTGKNADKLLQEVLKLVKKPEKRLKIFIPYEKGGFVDTLHTEARVESAEYGELIEVIAVCDEKVEGRLRESGIRAEEV
ncbi:MAG: GTPase HflX [Oscillospiraceae bacterium]|jgi:GTP-binding protein HflX|nr:GTPase HflX [Oscillospiraceae bacterium]